MTPSPSAFERALTLASTIMPSVIDRETRSEFAKAFMQAFLADADVRNEVTQAIATLMKATTSDELTDKECEEVSITFISEHVCNALQRMMEK